MTSLASSNGGWAAPEPHQIKMTPPVFVELSKPREGSGGCSREAGDHAATVPGFTSGNAALPFCKKYVGPTSPLLTSGHDSAL